MTGAPTRNFIENGYSFRTGRFNNRPCIFVYPKGERSHWRQKATIYPSSDESCWVINMSGFLTDARPSFLEAKWLVLKCLKGKPNDA